MTIEELFDLVTKPGPQYVYLTLRRDRLPRGETVGLCKGRRGPRGRICLVKEAPPDGEKYDVTAVFHKQKIYEMLVARRGT